MSNEAGRPPTRDSPAAGAKELRVDGPLEWRGIVRRSRSRSRVSIGLLLQLSEGDLDQSFGQIVVGVVVT